MATTVVHRFDVPWAVSGSGLTVSAVPGPGQGTTAMQVDVAEGARGEATFAPPSPLDLSAFTELRFRSRWASTVDGGAAHPFQLTLGYDDAGDQPGQDHRWYLTGRAGRWEPRRIGLERDRRSAVSRLRLRLAPDRPDVATRVTLDDLIAVSHDPAVDAEAALVALLTAEIGPVVVEEPVPAPQAGTAVLLGLSDVRDDPARAWFVPQRDSFRARPAGITCTVRPPARPIVLEYRLLMVGPDRSAAVRARAEVLRRLAGGATLRVAGEDLPVECLPAPPRQRERVSLAPITVRIGTRVETGERVEIPWVRSATIASAPIESPADTENVAVRL